MNYDWGMFVNLPADAAGQSALEDSGGLQRAWDVMLSYCAKLGRRVQMKRPGRGGSLKCPPCRRAKKGLRDPVRAAEMDPLMIVRHRS